MELIAIQVVLQLSEVVPKVRAIKFCAFLEKFAFTDKKKKRGEECLVSYVFENDS